MIVADTFLYFAYGSNMLAKRLQAPERCPSARALGIAELRGYELRWHKRSKKDHSGKCDVVPSAIDRALVLGVLFEIPNKEQSALDAAEGTDYRRENVTIICNGTERLAVAYIAKTTDASCYPYTWYRALVIAGAKEHGLPAPYIVSLESVAAIEDTNRARHELNMRLLEGVQA
jgi:gamma-glutamylcyclotransferase